MPIIKCPDCKSDVSDNAANCIKCGFPVSENIIICPECGTKHFKGINTCKECGYPYLDDEETISARPSRRDKGSSSVPDIPQKNEKLMENGSDSIARAAEISTGMSAAMAIHKSYVGISFLLLLILYPLFYLPGLIVNIIYLSESKKIKKQTGVTPGGHGCLVFLLWFFFIIPIALLFGLITNFIR